MSDYGALAVDLGVIAVIAISALLAYARGFVREFLTVAAVAAAVVATYYLFPRTNHIAREWVSNELIADGVTIVVLFIAVLALALLVTHPLAERVRASNLGFFDRWLGFFWGALRGALIVAILYVPLARLVPPNEMPAWLLHAKLMPYVGQLGDWLVSLVPQGIREATTL